MRLTRLTSLQLSSFAALAAIITSCAGQSNIGCFGGQDRTLFNHASLMPPPDCTGGHGRTVLQHAQWCSLCVNYISRSTEPSLSGNDTGDFDAVNIGGTTDISSIGTVF
jgi:hypothetical protein